MKRLASFSPPHSQTFLLHNGLKSPELPISDLELTRMQHSLGYTSLKDLLPANSSSSWYGEIPIKNPLVKQAALAYLQPMSTPTQSGDKNLFRRLREQCSCQSGCFEVFTWLRDAYSRKKFTSRARISWDECNAEDEQQDEEEDEKHHSWERERVLQLLGFDLWIEVFSIILFNGHIFSLHHTLKKIKKK